MKFLKKMLTVLLIISLLTFFAQLTFAQDNSEYGLLNVYTNNMLFKQNSVAVLKGRSRPGSMVSAVLYDKNVTVVTSDLTQTDRGGRFTLSFKTPEGSFDNYMIVIYCDNQVLDALYDVVFGELWLAGGQSNMQYPLYQSHTGLDMYYKGETGSEWIRFLSVPVIPQYNGSDLDCPIDPLEEIQDCFWHKANDYYIYGNSAVGYYFAVELMQKLNVPIGILDSNLGGSSITTWLSRDAVDSDSKVKNAFIADGDYISAEVWSGSERDYYRDMTVNFNKKIYPLRNFKISGMIWYQGETDFIYEWSEEKYAACLELMQKSYSELFEYDGTLPLVLTQLAPCVYGRMHGLAQWNTALCDFQSSLPLSRAVITNYDVDLDFIKESGSIHPTHKLEIGQRMAASALRMVYSAKGDTYTAATIDDYTIEDNAVIINIKNAGSALSFAGSVPNGFSICGSDGVFTAANAEIIDDNTVKIYSENVSSPSAAAYAYCENNHYANLYSTDNDGWYMPVSPFITDKSVLNSSWGGNEWTECENNSFFHLGDDGGIYDLWQSKNADISFDQQSSFSGANGLHIVKNQKKLNNTFSVYPVLNRKNDHKKLSFEEWNCDWSDYSTVSFMIRNNGSADVKLKRAKINNKGINWYSPAILGSTGAQAVIPADGEWHSITLDLNRLYLFGNDASAYYSNKRIDDITDFCLEFTAKEADLSIDSFTFTSEEYNKDSRITFSADFKNVKGIVTFITALFTDFIGLFVKK